MHSIPKKFLYDYHFTIKKLAKELREFNCVTENTKNKKTFSVPLTKKLKGLIKMEKKLQKPYLTNWEVLIVQNL